MAWFRFFLLWCGLTSVGLWGQLDYRLMVENPQARVSGDLVVLVIATNPGSVAQACNWPTVVHARVGQAQFPLDRGPSQEELSIEPGATVLQRYSGMAPEDIQGLVSFELTDLPAGRSYAEFIPAVPTDGGSVVADVAGEQTSAEVPTERRARFADNLSFYEPVYFVIGPRVSVNAKFQLGFK